MDAAGRAGLRRHRAHEVIPVTECPIADPRILATDVLTRGWSGLRALDVVAASAQDGAVVVPVPGTEVPVVRERVTAGSWTGEFEVSARGFWQVHPGAAATLVDRVLDGLAPRPGERVLDLYAGVGLFAAAFADAVGADGRVVAVEGDPLACDLARRNVAQRPWVRVIPGRVEDALPDDPVDLVVLDPPRTGAGRGVVEAIAGLGPRQVAYVACDPAALARDLACAQAVGYELGELTAYDAFPMTHHVECIAILRPSAAT